MWDLIFRTKCEFVEEHKLSESQSYVVITEPSQYKLLCYELVNFAIKIILLGPRYVCCVGPRYMWHDSFICVCLFGALLDIALRSQVCVKWHSYMCDTTPWHVKAYWDPIMCAFWVPGLCKVTRLYVWHVSVICATRLHDMWRPLGTQLCAPLGSQVCVTWRMLFDICDMTLLYVRHDSFTCMIWLFHMCDMTPSYVRHNCSICATPSYVWHNCFLCATRLLDILNLFRHVSMYRTMSPDVSLCLPMSHYLSLSLTVFHYVSLYPNISQYVSLCLNMSQYVLLCLTMSYYVSLCLTIFHYVLLCLTMSHYVSIYLTMSHYVPICLNISYYVLLCLSMSQCVSIYLTMSHYVSSCLTMSQYVSISLTMSHCVSLCLTMSPDVLLCLNITYYILLYLTMSHCVSLCLTLSHHVPICATRLLDVLSLFPAIIILVQQMHETTLLSIFLIM